MRTVIVYGGWQRGLDVRSIKPVILGRYVPDRIENKYLFFYEYDIIKKLSTLSSRKEVDLLEYISSFILSIAAGVICYYIGKWLDRKK